MGTPKSDKALERFNEFTDAIKQRLETGKRVYGDSSFDRNLIGIVEEIRQEILDQAGWAFILYSRLVELEILVDRAVIR